MDLDLEVIEKALKETSKNKANLYLWGGGAFGSSKMGKYL